MVGYEGQKMSKSLGNLVLVSRLRREGADPAAIRLALLAPHYRQDWEWTDADLDAAVQRLARWRAAVARPDGPPAGRLLDEMRDALGRVAPAERPLLHALLEETPPPAGLGSPAQRSVTASPPGAPCTRARPAPEG
jgi:leucyl-tRNA synthetase